MPYLPDYDDKVMADYLQTRYNSMIVEINEEQQECVFATVYKDRFETDHPFAFKDPVELMNAIDYYVDPRMWDSIVIVVFQNREGYRQFYRYKEALKLMTSGGVGY